MTIRQTCPPCGSQQGAALLVVMILLMVATLLGLSTTAGSVAGTRTAAGWSDRQRALYLADTVANAAITEIKTLVTSTNGDLATAMRVPTAGHYVRSDGNAPNWMQWPADSATGGYTVNSYPQARYFVVYEGEKTSGATISLLFTVVVRASAQMNGTASIVMQTFELVPS